MSTHLKTAWGYIRRSPFQALAVSFVLTLTFFVSTVVYVLVYSSSKMLTYFETRPQIIAFIKSDVKDTEIADLQHRLEEDAQIRDVKYVSKEEALSIYQEATSDNPLLGQLVSPSIFPASLVLPFSRRLWNFLSTICLLHKTLLTMSKVKIL